MVRIFLVQYLEFLYNPKMIIVTGKVIYVVRS